VLRRIHKQTVIKLKITFEGNSILEVFITEVQIRAHIFPSSLWWNTQRACNKMREGEGVEQDLLVEAKSKIQIADK
jgi:hypothetical protein